MHHQRIERASQTKPIQYWKVYTYRPEIIKQLFSMDILFTDPSEWEYFGCRSDILAELVERAVAMRLTETFYNYQLLWEVMYNIVGKICLCISFLLCFSYILVIISSLISCKQTWECDKTAKLFSPSWWNCRKRKQYPQNNPSFWLP